MCACRVPQILFFIEKNHFLFLRLSFSVSLFLNQFLCLSINSVRVTCSSQKFVMSMSFEQFKQQVIKQTVPRAPPLPPLIKSAAVAAKPLVQDIAQQTAKPTALTQSGFKKTCFFQVNAAIAAAFGQKLPGCLFMAATTGNVIGNGTERVANPAAAASSASSRREAIKMCDANHDAHAIVERQKHIVAKCHIPRHHCPLKWLTSYCPDYDLGKCLHKIHRLSNVALNRRAQDAWKLTAEFWDDRGCRAGDGEFNNRDHWHGTGDSCRHCRSDAYRNRDRCRDDTRDRKRDDRQTQHSGRQQNRDDSIHMEQSCRYTNARRYINARRSDRHRSRDSRPSRSRSASPRRNERDNRDNRDHDSSRRDFIGEDRRYPSCHSSRDACDEFKYDPSRPMVAQHLLPTSAAAAGYNEDLLTVHSPLPTLAFCPLPAAQPPMQPMQFMGWQNLQPLQAWQPGSGIPPLDPLQLLVQTASYCREMT